MSDTLEKGEEVKDADQLEQELRESLKQASEGETVSDSDSIREHVQRIRERS